MSKIIPYRIYVAGPYTPQHCDLHDASRIIQHHIDNAIIVGNKLIDKGHYAFVPHLSHYLHIHQSCNNDRGEWYYEFDNTFLTHWANALFYISASFGADNELFLAQKLHHKIFYKLSDVPKLQ